MIKHKYTGDIKTDVKSVLYANNKAKTYEHVKAVAEMNIKIAEQYGLDKGICELCGYLHDISAVFSPSFMLEYAMKNGWYIDESERKFPMILHQRISRVIVQEDFGITDERILSAVEHHTALKANPSPYDMAVFVADKLAWDQEAIRRFMRSLATLSNTRWKRLRWHIWTISWSIKLYFIHTNGLKKV